MKRQSNKEIAERHYISFKSYIETNNKGNGYPVRNGHLNRTQMAKDCGFDRGVFAQNQKVKKLLNQLESSDFKHQPPLNSEDSMINKKLEKELERTRQRLLESEAKVEELEKRLKKYSVFEEHMINTGRRITP